MRYEEDGEAGVDVVGRTSAVDATRVLHPTMEDVARRAGVSRALVSLVLNGSPKVSEKRRALVHEACRELGYRRNAVARQLASGRTRSVGVMLNDLHNPFFAEIYDGVAAATARLGYRTLLTSGGRSAHEQAAIDDMIEHRVDGIVLVSPRLDGSVIGALADTTPVVVIGRLVEHEGVDCVTADEAEGVGLAVRHLVELGHRSIVHVHGGPGAGARVRWDGYEQAMRAHGLKPDVIAGDFTEHAGIAAAAQIAARVERPTAMLAANDLCAIGALDAFGNLGLDVPGDISIVGYDNTFLARLRHLSLTSVDQSTEAMGELAMALLAERLQGRDAPVVRYVRPTLVVRATSGPTRR
jgi:DNA-binding LacI/PurR family transcriptional regulator